MKYAAANPRPVAAQFRTSECVSFLTFASVGVSSGSFPGRTSFSTVLTNMVVFSFADDAPALTQVWAVMTQIVR